MMIDESYVVNANAVKEMVIGRLLRDGKISKEVAEEYVEKWQVIVVEPTLFERWMNKFNSGKKEPKFKFVKFED